MNDVEFKEKLQWSTHTLCITSVLYFILLFVFTLGDESLVEDSKSMKLKQLTERQMSNEPTGRQTGAECLCIDA